MNLVERINGTVKRLVITTGFHNDPGSSQQCLREAADAIADLQRQVSELQAENERLREALEAIRDYPPVGNPNRTKSGYPKEVVYDDFAYFRLVDSYREAARSALSKEGG